ncbi:MAG: TPM domain-containing protein [Flavobacteriales bacterium]
MKSLSARLFSFLFLFSAFSALAQNCIPEKPTTRPYYVTDKAGVLSQDEIASLERRLQLFDDSTSNQIVVVIVADMCGADKAQFATEIGEKWGVGQADKDNGVVVLIKPTQTNGPRTTFIAVGRGLEGAITDAQASDIVRNFMNPQFKAGNMYGGISAGLDILIPLAQGEYKETNVHKNIDYTSIIAIVLGLILVLAIRLFSARSYARANGMSLWNAFFLGSLMGGSGRGSWGGGGGGSSFGGFGGGSFGGGGAGGDW